MLMLKSRLGNTPLTETPALKGPRSILRKEMLKVKEKLSTTFHFRSLPPFSLFPRIFSSAYHYFPIGTWKKNLTRLDTLAIRPVESEYSRIVLTASVCLIKRALKLWHSSPLNFLLSRTPDALLSRQTCSSHSRASSRSNLLPNSGGQRVVARNVRLIQNSASIPRILSGDCAGGTSLCRWRLETRRAGRQRSSRSLNSSNCSQFQWFNEAERGSREIARSLRQLQLLRTRSSRQISRPLVPARRTAQDKRASTLPAEQFIFLNFNFIGPLSVKRSTAPQNSPVFFFGTV